MKNFEIASLPVMETFFSIQGEGYHTGQSFYFIRLAGCDVGCHWCDVKESWDHNKHQFLAIDKIVKLVNKNSSQVIITGGEPLMWDLKKLTADLKINNIKVHLETSGAYDLTGTYDWICLSPKKRKLPKKEIYKKANELKIIVYNKDDFKFALQQEKKVNDKCKLFIQPEWSKFDEIKKDVVKFVKENPKWSVSLQTHKYLEID